ncbi:hypothetical protein C6A85_67255, partial [Mycobacterium sp. ITM-2017-0098]
PVNWLLAALMMTILIAAIAGVTVALFSGMPTLALVIALVTGAQQAIPAKIAPARSGRLEAAWRDARTHTLHHRSKVQHVSRHTLSGISAESS